MEALGVQVVNLIAGSLSACGIMALWFDTSLVLDYLKLFGLEKKFTEEYEKELFENPDIKFLEFWVSAFCTMVATHNILLIFAGYIFSMYFYFIFKKCQN